MARIRTVKPEVAKHELLFELERELKAPVRFAWVLLPGHCDREGRFKWRPRSLKTDILPYDECDFSRVLDAWLTRGLLCKYRVRNEWYGCIPTFRKHQAVNPREMASELPSMEEADEVIDNTDQQPTDASGTRAPRDDDASGTRANQELHFLGREGKGREGDTVEKNDTVENGHGRGGSTSERKREPAIPRGTRIPEDFVPDASWALKQIPDLDVEQEGGKFCDYWRARPGKDGLKVDWPATWRTWIRNAKDRGQYPRKAPDPAAPKPKEEPRWR